jgi:hypothetical protein
MLTEISQKIDRDWYMLHLNEMLKACHKLSHHVEQKEMMEKYLKNLAK